MRTGLLGYLLRNGVWAGGGRIATALAVFLANVLLARMLPPAGYGGYFVALGLVTVLSSLGILGLDQTAVRLVAVARARRGAVAKLAGRLLGLAAVGGLLVAGLLMALRGPILDRLLDSAALLTAGGFLALWILASVLQIVVAEIFRGLHDIRLASLLGGLRRAGVAQAVLLLAGLAVYRELGISTLRPVIALAAAVSLVVALAGGGLLAARLAAAPTRGDGLSTPSYRQIVTVAWPFLGATLLLTARTNGDSLVLAALSGADEVALYGAAVRLIAVLLIPHLVVGAVLPPLVADLHERGRRVDLERTVRLGATAAAAPTTLLFAALLIFGPAVLGALFGDYYRLAFPALVLLLGGHMAGVLAGPNAVVLAMTGHQRLLMAAMAASAIWVLGLGALLAPRHGAAGLAAAAASGLLLQNLLAVAFVRRRVGLWTTALASPRQIRAALAGLAPARAEGEGA
ncbi:MAG: oligosaccharide flippase family protein [Thermoanaerobaculia bacterium]|nr:oligosaccharide flippase family protein [Thermoanaerobaculia bacterium]